MQRQRRGVAEPARAGHAPPASGRVEDQRWLGGEARLCTATTVVVVTLFNQVCSIRFDQSGLTNLTSC